MAQEMDILTLPATMQACPFYLIMCPGFFQRKRWILKPSVNPAQISFFLYRVVTIEQGTNKEV
jgi:hypothetical protein